MKALLVQMIDMYLVFRSVKGLCHGNQLILGKCHERRLIPLAFFALSLDNQLQYHCINVPFNSGDNVATSCQNVVNFCWATPEITGLICVHRYLYLAKIDLQICIRRAAIQKCHEPDLDNEYWDIKVANCGIVYPVTLPIALHPNPFGKN